MMIAKYAGSLFVASVLVSASAFAVGCSSPEAETLGENTGVAASQLGGDRCVVRDSNGPLPGGDITVEGCDSVDNCILEACAGYSCWGTCNAPKAAVAEKGRCTVHDSNGPLPGGDLTVSGCSSVEACVLEACAGYSCVGDCTDP